MRGLLASSECIKWLKKQYATENHLSFHNCRFICSHIILSSRVWWRLHSKNEEYQMSYFSLVKVILFSVLSFSVESGSGCVSDSLTLYDGHSADDSTPHYKYCGSVGPDDFRTSTNTAILVFRTNSWINEAGTIIRLLLRGLFNDPCGAWGRGLTTCPLCVGPLCITLLPKLLSNGDLFFNERHLECLSILLCAYKINHTTKIDCKQTFPVLLLIVFSFDG